MVLIRVLLLLLLFTIGSGNTLSSQQNQSILSKETAIVTQFEK
jgi:hypothetical protein